MTTTTDSATLTSSTPAHQDPTAELDAASRELAAAVLDLLRALDRDDPCAITKRELAVRSIGRDLAARGEGLAECLASVRAGGRMVWPHLVATTRDKQRLGLIGSLLWETVDRVSELVAAGHHEASAARGDFDEQRRAELWGALISGSGEDPAFAEEAVRELGLGPPPYLVVQVEDGKPVDLGRTCRATTWLHRRSRSVGLLTVAENRIEDLIGHLAEHATHPTGLSGVVREPAELARAFGQAEIAVRIRAGSPGLTAFDQALPDALLQANPALMDYLVSTWLGPILDLPDPDRDELLRTLDAWAESGSSPSGAASLLYCHRNTVLNRMRRITTLLGRELAGPVPLELALALRATRASRRD